MISECADCIQRPSAVRAVKVLLKAGHQRSHAALSDGGAAWVGRLVKDAAG